MLTYMDIHSDGPHTEKHYHRSLVPYLTHIGSSELRAKIRDKDLSRLPTYSSQLFDPCARVKDRHYICYA